MELKDYVRILRRRWWVLLLCMLLGGAGAALATQRETPVYGSATTFFLSDGQGRPVDPLIAVQAQSRFASYSTLITSRPVSTRVAERVGGGGFGVSAAGIPGTIFFQLRTTANTPERALEVAQAYAAVFPEYVSQFEGTRLAGGTPLEVLEQPALNTAPLGPGPRRNQLVGLMLGLLVGTGLMLLYESLDNKIRNADGLERLTGVEVVAAVPMEFRGEQLVADGRPRSQRAEAVRLLRTNLQFSGIGGQFKCLVVTSANAGEGKTSVATDLAIAYAQAGKRVLLLDADLRKPRVAEVFKFPQEPGVSNILIGDAAIPDVMRTWGGQGQLQVLTGGTLLAKPSELLASAKMGLLLAELSAQNDLVIIDSAPLLSVADTTALLTHVDAVLVVIKTGATTRGQLNEVIARLRHVEARTVGLVVNGAKPGKANGYYTKSARRLSFRHRGHDDLLEVPANVLASGSPDTRITPGELPREVATPAPPGAERTTGEAPVEVATPASPAAQLPRAVAVEVATAASPDAARAPLADSAPESSLDEVAPASAHPRSWGTSTAPYTDRSSNRDQVSDSGPDAVTTPAADAWRR